MKTKLHILKAFHGDSIIIETFDSNNEKFVILVDGGPPETFKTSLVNELSSFKKIDLIILTHIDSDHIGGLIEYLKSSHSDEKEFCKIILNAGNLARLSSGTQITFDQGISLEKLLSDKYKNIQIITNIVSDKNIKLDLPAGIYIEILSPNTDALNLLYENWPDIDLSITEMTQICNDDKYAKDFNHDFIKLSSKKDKIKTLNSDIFNASSIAFTLKTKDFNGLFLGDANPNIVSSCLESKEISLPITFNYVKLSHHGSRFNISKKLLDCISCDNYIISTNGGRGRAKHPDRETIAKIVEHSKNKKLNIIFNYPLEDIEEKTGKLFHKEELKRFNYINKNSLV